MISGKESSIEIQAQRILIVDDDPNMLFGVSRTLAKAGFDVSVSSDGGIGILKAQSEQPDLIILDVNMPKMNGFQVKHILDTSPITKNIPIVFLTALHDKATVLDGLKISEDYITKPFDPEVLVARIKEVILKNANSKPAIEALNKIHTSVDHIHEFEKSINIHDYGTTGHTIRVTLWFIVLAKRLGIVGLDLENARNGAMLHDVGNLAISERILNKPSPLNQEEWKVIRKHPKMAIEILKNIPVLQSALDIPNCHHERWDGKGYPKGLSGEAIPFAARIFSVVDTFDALHTKRPYKEELSEQDALEMIRSESGKQFDPQVVDYFLANFRSIKEEVTNESITNNIGN